MPGEHTLPRRLPGLVPVPVPEHRALGGWVWPRRLSLLLTWLLAGLLSACALAPPGAPVLADRQAVLLLGEVHDNAAQHAWRLQVFQAWLARGARPALLMEQFDQAQQPAIAQARRSHPGAGDEAVAALIAAGAPGGGGWDWAHYRPFVALALRHDLPVVAVNVSRDAARLVMRQGLAASGFNPVVPADILQAQADAIVASHCGLVDAALAGRMALAQVARDQAMARAVAQHAARGVLLLAGNGHVRRDWGVPRWLSPATLARTQAVGLLELGAADEASAAAAFDRVVTTAAQPRDAPCAAMQRPAAASGQSAAGQPATGAAPR